MSYNKVILEGRIGQDPEIRTTKTGEKFATFSLATSKSWKDKSGNKQSKSEWHNCIAWKGTASIIEKYTTKGSEVLIEGELSYNDYVDAGGCKKKIANIVVGTIVFIGRPGQKSEAHEPESEPEKEQASEPKKRGPGRPPKSELGDDSDMPF